MGDKIRLSTVSLVVISLFGCAFINNKSFSEYNYGNIKPNREAREEYIAAHPKLGLGISNLIKSGIVGTGMSKEEVVASWGKPDRIEKTPKFGADEI